MERKKDISLIIICFFVLRRNVTFKDYKYFDIDITDIMKGDVIKEQGKNPYLFAVY